MVLLPRPGPSNVGAVRSNLEDFYNIVKMNLKRFWGVGCICTRNSSDIEYQVIQNESSKQHAEF